MKTWWHFNADYGDDALQWWEQTGLQGRWQLLKREGQDGSKSIWRWGSAGQTNTEIQIQIAPIEKTKRITKTNMMTNTNTMKKTKPWWMTIIILGGIRDKLLQKGLESQTLCLPLTGNWSPPSPLSLSSSPLPSKSSRKKTFFWSGHQDKGESNSSRLKSPKTQISLGFGSKTPEKKQKHLLYFCVKIKHCSHRESCQARAW